MAFINIDDPMQRKQIIDRIIQNNAVTRARNLLTTAIDQESERDFRKLFKPLIEPVTSTQKAVEALPAKISQPIIGAIESGQQLPAIMGAPSSEADLPMIGSPTSSTYMDIGEIAGQYMKKFFAKDKRGVDQVFGITTVKEPDGDEMFKFGQKEIEIQDNDIVVDGKTYRGSPGLWQLIVLNEPDKMEYSQRDLDTYAQLLEDTDAIRNPDNPNRSKSSKSKKYTEIIKPIWDRIKSKSVPIRPKPSVSAIAPQTPMESTITEVAFPTRKKPSSVPKGKGVGGVMILPSDCNALVQRLALCQAGAKAGNTGSASEGVAILDELFRQSYITPKQYKLISSSLKV